jgi:hypothetical protein
MKYFTLLVELTECHILLTMNDLNRAWKDKTVAALEVGTCATTIAENQPAPEWIELLPAGDFVGRDGRGPFRVSNAEAVIAATDALRMEGSCRSIMTTQQILQRHLDGGPRQPGGFARLRCAKGRCGRRLNGPLTAVRQ